jgi:hypothetical protein
MTETSGQAFLDLKICRFDDQTISLSANINQVIRHGAIAMIHLCDLLVLELNATGEERVFEIVKDLTRRLLDITERQSSHSLLAETTLLQSKIALVELDVEQAREFLVKAYNIAEEKGLHLLAHKVAHEQDLLQSQLHKWESIIQQPPSRQEMIDVAQLDDLLERMIHKTGAVLMDEEKGISREDAAQKKYKLVYLDQLKDQQKVERNSFLFSSFIELYKRLISAAVRPGRNILFVRLPLRLLPIPRRSRAS